MEPVVTPEEMGAIDADAPEPVSELIERAGWAVARAAVGLLGRRYGARVAVLAGKGNNGADGRSAARHLERRGVRTMVLDAARPDTWGPLTSPRPGDGIDLVIDAAYGTGFRGSWEPPPVSGPPVLAVDVPSGVDGLTGQVSGQPLAATRTVTFAAPKPGLLLAPGRFLAGEIEVADIGLDCSRARIWHLGSDDVAQRWPRPGPTAHKWGQAVWVIGGGPTMPGAPSLAAAGSARGGGSLVGVSIPGRAEAGPPLPAEAILQPLPTQGWAQAVVEGAARFGALVLGPGLAVDPATGAQVREVVAGRPGQPVVLDGGAIDAVVADPGVLGARSVPAVLTPHDGELARLLGQRPGPDRLAEVRALAARLGAVVVAKGPTTVVADPDGQVLVSTAGDQRLATAGTGDVLAGLVGAGLAGGLEPLLAGGLAAELHGLAGRLCPPGGTVAADLVPAVAQALSSGALPRSGGPAD